MKKFTFRGSQGHDLAARLDEPDGPIRAYALFAHCFTCGKDIFGASRIARALTENGIACMRFDFTGLGASEGEFENTNFTSNVQDLVAIADHMAEELEAPQIIIGHSLGGAAVLVAAGQIESVQAVATIGAPSDAAHVAHHFESQRDEILAKGEAEVQLAGRPFKIQKQFIDDIEGQNMQKLIGGLKKPLIVMHAPLDNTVGIENAEAIFKAAKHPKSFVSLDKADHLLSRKEDAEYAAHVVSAWAMRYIDVPDDGKDRKRPKIDEGKVMVQSSGKGDFQHNVYYGNKFEHLADEPLDFGGTDTGPTPYGLLKAALGACKAMTVRVYANHKRLPLDGINVVVDHRVDVKGDDRVDYFDTHVEIFGDDLTEEQKDRMVEIAGKCPVHRTLMGDVQITTKKSD